MTDQKKSLSKKDMKKTKGGRRSGLSGKSSNVVFDGSDTIVANGSESILVDGPQTVTGDGPNT